MSAKLYILQNVQTKFAKNRKSHFSNFLYLAEKLYMKEIQAFHNEVLRSIERGLKWWTDEFVDDKYRTLVSRVSSSTYNSLTGGVKYENHNPIWCAFQSGACYEQEDYFWKLGDI